jgi:hypothetical protein
MDARPGRRSGDVVQAPVAELIDVLVQRPTQSADAVLVHAMDAELLDEPIDLAGVDAV